MYLYTYIHTYITLHYITLHYITLHYITLHYITLHFVHTYIHAYIVMMYDNPVLHGIPIDIPVIDYPPNIPRILIAKAQ